MLTFDPDRSRYETDQPIGPAGVAIATVARGVIAEVDIAAETIARVQITSPGRADELRSAVDQVLADEVASVAMVRVVLATDFESTDDPTGASMWLLDRVSARLELEEASPALSVRATDADLVEARTLLESGTLNEASVSPELRMSLQRIIDNVASKHPDARLRTTADLLMFADMLLGVRGVRGPSISAEPSGPLGPHVEVLSPDLDLALSLERAEPQFEYDPNGTLEMTVHVQDPDRFAKRFECFLIEPDHDAPVLAIARLAVVDHALVGRFRVPGALDWSALDLSIVPLAKGFDAINGSVARAILAAEIGTRTAIRLAQKGRVNDALTRMDQIIETFRRRRLAAGDWFLEPLLEIRARISAGGFPPRFLADFPPTET